MFSTPFLRLLLSVLFGFITVMMQATANDDENYDNLFNKGKTIVYKEVSGVGPSSPIEDITQTSDGRLWLASQSGLHWYDGFQRNREQDINNKTVGPKGSIVSIIVGDKHFGLWIYTKNRKIALYHTQTKEYTTIDNPLKLKISDIIIDDSNTAWFATNKGLFFDKLENKKHILSKYLPAESSLKTQALHIHNGYLYFYNEEKIYKFETNKKNTPPKIVVSDVIDINKIFVDSTGSMWIVGSQPGLEKINIKKERIKINDDISVQGIAQSVNGEIWIASQALGLYVYDSTSNNLINHVTKNPNDELSLDSDYLLKLFLDRSGLLWIGANDNGLNYINTKNHAYKNLSTSVTDSKHLIDNSVFYLLSTKSSDIWVGHGKNGITVLNRHGDFQHHYLTELKSGTVYAMTEDQEGMIWASVKGGQIHRIDPINKRVESMRDDDLTISPKNFNLIIDHDNRLFVSGRKGIFKYIPETRSLLKVDFLGDDLVDHYNVSHSFVDNSGNSWFAGREWIAYISKGSNQAQAVWVSAIEKKHVKSLFKTQSGIIYTILGDDLFKLSLNSNKVNLKLEDVGVSGSVSGRFYETENGNLWASHYHVDTQSGKVNRLSYSDGILADLDRFYSRLKLSDGTQIHGSSTGLIFFRPWLYQKWTYTPPLHIDEILFDDRKQNENSDEITISADVSRVKFTISSLDYSFPTKNRYAHRLLGYQEEWVEQGIEGRQVIFTNLDPGEYIMEFKGSNKNEVWSTDVKRITVHVLPHWYETVWFRTVVGLIILSLIWLSFQWRLRHLRHRQKNLEEQVTGRTKELSLSLHELNITKNQLVESEKQASLGRLVRGVAHELNTPIGVIKSTASGLFDNSTTLSEAFAAGTLSPTQLQKFLELSKNSSQLIENNIDRMSRLTNDFKEIAADEAHGSVLKITLKSLFQTINIALSSNLEKQGVKIVFEGDPDLHINTNENMLRKVIVEIVENCAYHGFPVNTSSPDTDTDTDVNKTITIKAKEWQSTGVKLMIADNGIGMTADVRSEVFEPFFTTSSESEKIGLGLHSVFNWVTQSLRGQIVCRSQLGKGSCFILTLKSFDSLDS